MTKIVVIFVCISLLAAIPCSAATITVNWDGSGDYTTIQAGIDAAVSGADTVVVAEGTYVENISFGGKNIILRSTDPDDWDVVAATIIDGNNAGTVVTFNGSETSACQLTGFTITNGNADGVSPLNCGGGIYGGGTQAEIMNCTITGNSANYDGGGLSYCDGSITKCTITDNLAGHDGGGLDDCDGSITNCVISGNSAEHGGGLRTCNGAITNCTITGNLATIYGGGLNWCGGAITNCTITDNSAEHNGGGLHACKGSITNCIVWRNTINQLYVSSTPTYSCIENWIGGGAGNINSDPLFVNPANGDYHLKPWSRCVDGGTNSPPGGLATTDIEGNPRLIDSNNDGTAIADMGVYEAYPSSEPVIWLSKYEFIFFADEGGANPAGQTLTIHNAGGGTLDWTITESCDWLAASPTSDSSTGEPNDVALSIDITGLALGEYNCQLTVSDPCAMNSPQIATVILYILDEDALYVPIEYPTIQAAINAAFNGETVIVADGTYTGAGNRDIDFLGKAITVKSANGPQNCIIDCQDSGRGFYFHNDEGPDSVLDGLTITNGSGQCFGSLGCGSRRGGGIYIDSCSPTIQNCVISGNSMSAGWSVEGGGIYLKNSQSLIDSCIISNNTLLWWDCSEYTTAGGGIFLASSDVTIRNCIIAGNTSWAGGGGGVDGNNSAPAITNSIIIGNSCYSCGDWGGGLLDCDGPITNCVIIDNYASYRGGGLSGCDGPITNCIIWDNEAGNVVSNQLYNSSVPTYSCIQDWTGGGVGNIDSSPLFADPDNGDYHLKSSVGRWDPDAQIWTEDPGGYLDPNGTPDDPNDDFWIPSVHSPYIDAGDPCSVYLAELWPHGKRINMGAYGGAAEASMSLSDIGNIADLNNDDVVDLADFSIFGDEWPNTTVLLKQDLDRNGLMDVRDVSIMAFNWLWEEQ